MGQKRKVVDYGVLGVGPEKHGLPKPSTKLTIIVFAPVPLSQEPSHKALAYALTHVTATEIICNSAKLSDKK